MSHADGFGRGDGTSVLDFQLSRLQTLPQDAGPATYYPNVRMSSTIKGTPTVRFSVAPRFSEGARVMISKHHQADMLGMQSPGPKYNPQFRDREVHVLWWGDKPSEDKERRAAMLKSRATFSEVGPAAYSPNINAVRAAPPATRFAAAGRFALNLSKGKGVGGEGAGGEGQESKEPSRRTIYDSASAFKSAAPAAPAFSIGKKSAEQFEERVLRSQAGVSPGYSMPSGGWRASLFKHAPPSVTISRTPRFPEGKAEEKLVQRRREAEDLRAKLQGHEQGQQYQQQMALLQQSLRKPKRRMTTTWCP